MDNFIIDLLASYFVSGMGSFWFFPLIALGFVSFVPSLVRALFSWR